MGDAHDTIDLGETPLTLDTVALVAQGAKVGLSDAALQRVRKARALVEAKASGPEPVYGVTTGFGALAEVRVPPEEMVALQRNLILSHAAGVGAPLSRQETRAMMLLRAQTLALGYSGVRPEVIDFLIDMLNCGVHPLIPEKGSVGASGDLAPLAHLALAMLGEGMVELEGNTIAAADALARASLRPMTLAAKEGLSLVNGTQTMAAVGGLAVLAALRLCRLADVAGAMTLEGLAGSVVAFDPRIQEVRPHPGQAVCAGNLRRLLEDSGILARGRGGKMQDPYSLRCMPQVHGATRDALTYARAVFERELNSATDNPLVFTDSGEILSGGNFHGQPLALALDFAAIALAEIGNVSERRVEQLVNPALSGLPPFLVPKSGTHSGYMIAQVTAASLVNENKVLATPASIDSIPGSASREDHVSMGMTSARKLREIVTNTHAILAVEILCAAQAIDFRAPASPGAGSRAAHAVVRKALPHLEADRLVARDIEAVLALERRNAILDSVEAAIGKLD
ncbi:MAG: histidine ammonia-lyase [Deltaproteobacteria bacterium]|nr:histidine ammonia-lyase [Deltaproteobacteria bacterium]